MDKPALKFIGSAAEVTLYDVQFNKTTLKLVAHFKVRDQEEHE
ncbi:hypothetical protein [Paenibacillus mucilaginosus]|nr:hypothetical protein [Paenibacillus mucilaginosus]